MNSKLLRQIVCFGLLLSWVPMAYAFDIGTFDIEDMLLNLQKSLGPLFNLAVGAAYLMGVTLCMKGVYDLKIYGESRTQMSNHTQLKAPLFTLFVGGMCIYSPSAFQTVMMSTFGYSSVLAYNNFPTTSGESLSQSAIVILQVIQVVGAYAFVRGWVLLSRSASSQGGQHGTFGKGITYVVGGAFAINIVGTCNVIANTLGITF